MSLGQQTLSGFIWTFISTIGTKFSTLIVGIVLARLLAPEVFGLVAMLYIFFEISQSFVNSGFSQALIREKKLSEEDKSTTFSVNVIVSVLFYSLLWFGAPYIALFYDEPALVDLTRFMGLNILIQAVTIVQSATFTQELRFKELSVIGILSSIGAGVIAIILAYMDFGVWALAVKYLVTTFFTSIFLYSLNPWKPTHFIVQESFNRLFGFGSKLFASGLLDTTFRNIYKVVIGKFFSASVLGFYTQAQLYVNQVSQGAVGTLQKVTYPILSKTRGNKEQLKQAYRKIILASSFVIFPATIGLALIAEPMILTLVGEKWLPAVPFLQILCVSGALHHLHSVNLNVLKVVGRSDLFLKLEIIKKINITIAIVIGLQFGIWGLLIAKVISSYVALYINMYYTKSFIDYTQLDQIKDLIPVILQAIPMAGIVFLVIQYVNLPHYFILIIGIVTGVTTYIITTVLFKSEALKHIQTVLGHRFPVLNRLSL